MTSRVKTSWSSRLAEEPHGAIIFHTIIVSSPRVTSIQPILAAIFNPPPTPLLGGQPLPRNLSRHSQLGYQAIRGIVTSIPRKIGLPARIQNSNSIIQ